jgi:hypothetical protein
LQQLEKLIDEDQYFLVSMATDGKVRTIEFVSIHSIPEIDISFDGCFWETIHHLTTQQLLHLLWQTIVIAMLAKGQRVGFWLGLHHRCEKLGVV